MKFSTKGRYGTRALLDLAMYRGKEPVPIKDIAKRQHISLPYLEHLIAPMIAAGMVRSIKGPKGGILLVKNPDEIKLSEIISIFEGSSALVECVDDPGLCPRADSCAARDVWDEVKKAMNGVLESITLQDLVEKQKGKKAPLETMYYI